MAWLFVELPVCQVVSGFCYIRLLVVLVYIFYGIFGRLCHDFTESCDALVA